MEQDQYLDFRGRIDALEQLVHCVASCLPPVARRHLVSVLNEEIIPKTKTLNILPRRKDAAIRQMEQFCQTLDIK